ncbi:MAG: FkbM family methyltransferase [Solirubrobacterales bacterium]
MRNVARIARLGRGPLSKAKIFLVGLAMARSRWPARRLTTIRIRAMGQTVRFVVSALSDLLVLRDTFLFDDFRKYTGDPRVIVDLGSNIGATVVYFRLKYPEASIVAVEPDPFAFEKLRRNTAGFEGIELRNVAVTAEPGQVTLYQHSQSWGSSLFEWWQGATPVSVPAQTLDGLIAELGLERIDLLKIDIEGAEFQVLPSSRQLHRVQAIIGEIHAYLSDEPVEQLLSCLEGFDVRVPPLAGRANVSLMATRHQRLSSSAGPYDDRA